MPGLDQRGPEGKGARTGRGMGRCNSNRKIDPENEVQGETAEKGRRQGFGFGQGRRQGLRRGRMND